MLFAAEMFEKLEAYGYAGIIVYMVLTGCGLPMPEEVAIIAGGVAAATGGWNPWLTLGALLIGALLGDIVMYSLGRYFGRRLIQDHPIFSGFMTAEREQKVEQMLCRHGWKVLFGARFMVGIRGPMYITAGILKMPFKKFFLADLFCATIVVTLFFGISYVFGDRIGKLIREGEGVLTIVVLSLLAVAGIVFAWYHFRKKKAFENAVVTAVEKIPLASDLPPECPVPTAHDDAAETNGQPAKKTGQVQQRPHGFAGRSAEELEADDEARQSEDAERDREFNSARRGSSPEEA